MKNVYLNESHERIVATLKTLEHFRAFLRSDCTEMRDPYSGWHGNTLTKEEARRKLTWLIDVAINRKAGIPDRETDFELVRLAYKVNTPRVVVRENECPPRYRERLRHRLTTLEEERS